MVREKGQEEWETGCVHGCFVKLRGKIGRGIQVKGGRAKRAAHEVEGISPFTSIFNGRQTP